ncbi:MAG: Gfo/Idh/MocA family oxidoreductase [bacterium]
MDPVAVGVVGLGRMGLHHVRCVQQAAGMTLAGACDVDPARRATLPEGVPFTTDAEELLGRCDALVLAVPTDRHAALARGALARGKHLLVEKPLARNVAECDALAAAARASGVVVGVGHVERWNAAWRETRPRIKHPLFAEGHRLASFDPRGTEVDVVLDLMIHDLDLVLDAFGAEPVRVEAVGVPVLTDRVDIANVRLEFPGGALCGLTASRVSREPVRKLRLFQSDGYFSVDFRTQEVEVLSRGADGRGMSRGRICPAEGHNPLVKELEAFAAAIRGEPSDLVSPEAGARAVRLAERIVASMDERRDTWAAAFGTSWGGGLSSS